MVMIMVLFWYNVPPTAKTIRRRGLGEKSHTERTEKPVFELTTLGLQGVGLYNVNTAASSWFVTQIQMTESFHITNQLSVK